MSPIEITEAAAIIGYGVGMLAEQRAVSQAAEKEARLSEAAGIAMAAQSAEVASKTQRMTRWASRNLLAPLALTAAVAGGVEAYGWAAAEAPQPTAVGLEVVVDHSGATKLNLGNKPTVKTINSLAEAFGTRHVNGEALVAGTNHVRPMKFAEVSTDDPWGDAPLNEATTQALDKATGNKASSTSTRHGVLVITNGNRIGSPDSIVKQAKARNAAMFIVNVEKSSQTSGSTTRDFERMARKTHGEYWSANETNADKVVKKVTASLAPQEAKAEAPDKTIFKVLGGMAGLAAVMYYRRRNKYALGTGPRGE